MVYYVLFALSFVMRAEMLAEIEWKSDRWMETPRIVQQYRGIYSLMFLLCLLCFLAILVMAFQHVHWYLVIVIWPLGCALADITRRTNLGSLLILNAFTPIVCTIELIWGVSYFWRLG